MSEVSVNVVKEGRKTKFAIFVSYICVEDGPNFARISRNLLQPKFRKTLRETLTQSADRSLRAAFSRPGLSTARTQEGGERRAAARPKERSGEAMDRPESDLIKIGRKIGDASGVALCMCACVRDRANRACDGGGPPHLHERVVSD